ncbi:MAG TPA: hypothetical protein VF469_25725, partial [Kofleriaceae bacterium]
HHVEPPPPAPVHPPEPTPARPPEPTPAEIKPPDISPSGGVRPVHQIDPNNPYANNPPGAGK